MTSMYTNFTVSIENPSPPQEWAWSFRTIIVLTICSLITILTILGNGLVLISVKFRLRARSYSDYFIVSLCLADFFVGLFVMPLMTIHSLHLRWPFHYRLCYIWMSIDFTCSTASFLTLASMALDRYWALTAPYFHLRNRSYSSVLVFIISSWAIPFAIWPGSIFLSHHFSTNQPSCVHPAHPFIIAILCTFFYYIPLLFMLVCYSRIIVNIKNIEVLIKGTWNTINLNSAGHDLNSTKSNFDSYDRNDKTSNTTTTSSLSSLRSIINKFFQRNQPKTSINKKDFLLANEKPVIKHDIILNQQNSNEYHHIIQQKRGSSEVMIQGLKVKSLVPKISTNSHNHHRSTRQPTTATFTGKKRCLNEHNNNNINNEEKNHGNDMILNYDEEQQLVRTRLNTRTSSLPAARCISYYYYQHQTSSKIITTKAIVEEQHRDIRNNHHYPINSLVPERTRSQSHSSAQCMPNNGHVSDTDHSSSFENGADEEQRRSNRRTQPSRLSTSYNSNRYSQRAVAQFMHERNKARLRRNQKASRMLGILLAVFLICWLPFTISYPIMIFHPNKFRSSLESIIFWFGYVNSLLNPFLYVYSSRNFRQAIIETLCCYVRIRSRQQLRYQWSLRLGHN